MCSGRAGAGRGPRGGGRWQEQRARGGLGLGPGPGAGWGRGEERAGAGAEAGGPDGCVCWCVCASQIFEWWYFRKYGTSFIEQVSVSHLRPLLGGVDNSAPSAASAAGGDADSNRQSVSGEAHLSLSAGNYLGMCPSNQLQFHWISFLCRLLEYISIYKWRKVKENNKIFAYGENIVQQLSCLCLYLANFALFFSVHENKETKISVELTC